MTLWLDGKFWSRYFEEIFIKQINAFCDTITNRVLPTFDSIEKEAHDITQAEYERLGRLPASEDDIRDMADIAERAREVGIAHYEALSAARQTLINMSVAVLYHMFEQQLLLFHRRQVLYSPEEDDISKIKVEELKKRLLGGGLNIETMPSWKKIDELKVATNSVKHAEGRSAEQLKQLRPDLFVSPLLKADKLFQLLSSNKVYLPLAGEDIYLSVDDLKAYESAVISFWQEFGSAIREHSNR